MSATTTEEKIREALVAHFRDGVSLRKALGPLRDTYYGMKQSGSLAEIESEARSAAERERRQLQTASDSRQVQATMALRDSAAELLVDALPGLRRILTTDGYAVETLDGKEKWVSVYPRDFLGALKAAQELAQYGTLPPEGVAPLQELPEAPRLPALTSPPINFQTVALPPGSHIEIQTPVVVDGEFVEDS